MERLFSVLNIPREREKGTGVTITPLASAHLRQLTQLPNPNMIEFVFLGLGKNGVIDTILTADPEHFMSGTGVVKTINGNASRTNREEVISALTELDKTGREKDLMVIGHFHPPMLKDAKKLLDLSSMDISYVKKVSEGIPELVSMYTGIAVNTKRGPMLRLNRISDLNKVNTYKDLKKIFQLTFKI